MTMTDPIADMLTRLRNANQAYHDSVSMPYSKLKQGVAEILKPHYRYLCKRPCFHDEFLSAFNNPNVTLVDCPAGMDHVSERGPVIDGHGTDT